MKKEFVMIVAVILMTITVSFGTIPTLSIYQIQYTTNADGTSNYDTQTVNCTGGVVIHKWGGGRQRVVLYDPNNSTCWGGIVAKGPNGAYPFNSVNLGDWVALDNVTVYDWQNKSRGTTILYLGETSAVRVLSTSNPLPEPLEVDVNDIAVVYDPVNETCYVTDHRAEKYEAMYLQVRVVTVGDVNVGKSLDNYSLKSNEDPDIYCWASDYMNIDLPSGALHLPQVAAGQRFCSVSGILEQYTYIEEGWDYYQILTISKDDLVIQQPGDLDGDCDVDLADLAILSNYWLVGTK
jgi:hypothetical protein